MRHRTQNLIFQRHVLQLDRWSVPDAHITIQSLNATANIPILQSQRVAKRRSAQLSCSRPSDELQQRSTLSNHHRNAALDPIAPLIAVTATYSRQTHPHPARYPPEAVESPTEHETHVHYAFPPHEILRFEMTAQNIVRSPEIAWYWHPKDPPYCTRYRAKELGISASMYSAASCAAHTDHSPSLRAGTRSHSDTARIMRSTDLAQIHNQAGSSQDKG